MIEGAVEFWNAVARVWTMTIFGARVDAILSSMAILALAFMLRGLIATVLISAAKSMAGRSKTLFDDKLVNTLRGPAKMAPLLLAGYIVVAILGLTDGARDLAGKVLDSGVALTIFFALRATVDPLTHLVDNRSHVRHAIVDWARKFLRIAFVVVGFAAVLEIWGVPVGPLLTGMGIFGVAVALGAQDLFKNLIAGVAILVEQRFSDGDWIMVDGVVEGTVENIGFRSTRVRRFDKGPVFVPNTLLSDNAVVNFSRMTHRRIYWKLALDYRSTVPQLQFLCDEILKYVSENADFAQPPEVSTFCYVDSFNDSSIDVMLYCFTRTTNWGEWLGIKEELAHRIKTIVEEAGTEFAFPTQTEYFIDAANTTWNEPEHVAAHRSSTRLGRFEPV